VLLGGNVVLEGGLIEIEPGAGTLVSPCIQAGRTAPLPRPAILLCNRRCDSKLVELEFCAVSINVTFDVVVSSISYSFC